MRKSFNEVKKASDDYISMTFYLMCVAIHNNDKKFNSRYIESSAWFRDLLTQTSYAKDIGLLSEDEVRKIDLACTEVF